MTANTQVSNNQRAARAVKEYYFVMKEIAANWNGFDVSIPLGYVC